MTGHMPRIPREKWLLLSGLELNAYKALQSRHQLPFVLGPAAHDAYDPLGVLMMVLANEFADQGFNRTRAGTLGAHGYAVGEHWADVARTSEAMHRGRKAPEELFLAIFESTGPQRGEAFCGTLTEIAKKFPNPARIALVNVTRAAVKIREQAAKHKIDLDAYDFWTGPV